MLACTDTITVIKCDGEFYTVAVYVGVSWYDKAKVKLENTGLVFANATRIRIPAASLPISGVLPEVGDQVIRGRLPLDADIRTPADLAPYKPRRIMAVGDNRRGGLPHVAVTAV